MSAKPPATAHAGDPGFEWQGNFVDTDAGGLTFTHTDAGLVFVSGYAYYTGPFAPDSTICWLPDGWGDEIGADVLCFGSGDPANAVAVYASPNGLHVGGGESLPADGYVSIQAFWRAR